jgi:hypothetical protein
MADDVLGFFEGEIDLPKERRCDVHRSAQSAESFFFS